jgi:tape measure protein
MANNNSVKISVDFDNKKLKSGLQESQQALDRFSKQELTQLRDKFKEAQQASAGLSEALAIAGPAALAVAAGLTAAIGAAKLFFNAFTSATKAVIDAGNAMEKQRGQLAALVGSVGSASVKIRELQQLAAKTPGLTTQAAVDAFGVITSAGIRADSAVKGIIQTLGKLNAVSNIDIKDFGRNLIQIFQQGFERGDIKEALGKVPFFEELLRSAFGTDDPDKLRKLKASGKITGETFVEGITEAFNEKFPKVQETTEQKFEKLRDALNAALGAIGVGILDDLSSNLQGVSGLVETIANQSSRLYDLGSAFGGLTVEIIKLLDKIVPVSTIFEYLTGESVFDGLDKVVNFFDRIRLVVASVADRITDLKDALIGLAGAAAAAAVGDFSTALKIALLPIPNSNKNLLAAQDSLREDRIRRTEFRVGVNNPDRPTKPSTSSSSASSAVNKQLKA